MDERTCPHCGRDFYATKPPDCPGPGAEQMHRNLARNLAQLRAEGRLLVGPEALRPKEETA